MTALEVMEAIPTEKENICHTNPIEKLPVEGTEGAIIELQPGEWYNAYREGDVSVPCYILYKGSTRLKLQAKIYAWGESYPAKFSLEGGVEKFRTEICGHSYVGYADRRDDLRYYRKTYGKLPSWLREE